MPYETLGAATACGNRLQGAGSSVNDQRIRKWRERFNATPHTNRDGEAVQVKAALVLNQVIQHTLAHQQLARRSAVVQLFPEFQIGLGKSWFPRSVRPILRRLFEIVRTYQL
jgi:hypothetical protein